MTIDEWSTSRKVFHGFDYNTYRPTVIDLGNTTNMNAVASQPRTKIPLDDELVITKHKTISEKIKIEDCVYDGATGEARRGFRPEDKLLVHASRAPPERVEADVAAARAFVQDLFPFRGVEADKRRDNFDLETMPLGILLRSPSEPPSIGMLK